MTTEHSSPRSKFLQQRLSHWNPVLTIPTAIPILIIIGVSFVIIGCILLYINKDIIETKIDYTNCLSSNDNRKTCAQMISKSTDRSCFCSMNFYLEKNISAPVYIYYALTNFYQNHRSYVLSKDNEQLLGKLSVIVDKSCAPYDYADVNGILTPIAPCGAIANSMFNDEIKINYKLEPSVPVPLIKKNISWPILKSAKFKNPPGDLKTAFKDYAAPINWRKPVWELDPSDPTNNGLENEDFIVWMQPATLSSFRKLYRRVNHTGEFDEGLPSGKYTLEIVYNFPVASFRGTKSIIITNTSVFGSKNSFLCISYIVVGALCIILSFIFFIIQHNISKFSKD